MRSGTVTLSREGWYYISGKLAYHGNYSYPTRPDFKQGSFARMQDVVTHDFQKRRARGIDTSNPMIKDLSVYSNAANSQYRTDYSGWSTSVGAVIREQQVFSGNPFAVVDRAPTALPSFLNTDIANAQLYCLQKAYSRVNGNALNAGVFAAEAKKTLQLIRSPLRGAFRILTKIKSRSARSIKERALPGPAAIAEAWLQYRYGLVPLLGDIASATQHLRPFKTRYSDVQAARHSYQTQFDSGRVRFEKFVEYYLKFCGYTSQRAQISVNAGVRYRFADMTYSEFFRATNSLNLTDVPGTVWELVPFSFIADWFVDIQSWLSAITPKPGVEYLSNWVSTTTSQQSEAVIEYLANNTAANGVQQGWVKCYGECRDVYHNTNKTRSVNLTVPLKPLLTPGNLSLIHSVDSTALIVGKISRLLQSLKH